MVSLTSCLKLCCLPWWEHGSRWSPLTLLPLLPAPYVGICLVEHRVYISGSLILHLKVAHALLWKEPWGGQMLLHSLCAEFLLCLHPLHTQTTLWQRWWCLILSVQGSEKLIRCTNPIQLISSKTPSYKTEIKKWFVTINRSGNSLLSYLRKKEKVTVDIRATRTDFVWFLVNLY